MSAEIRNEDSCEKSPSHAAPAISIGKSIRASDWVKDLEQRNEQLQKELVRTECLLIDATRENEVLKKLVRGA